ncbi:MAG TPA: DNA primase [Candidatus Dormibacteraeota bacterium]|nr:DNA primase [Candidatus Dormibacteraeota bacterium]
MYSEGTRERVRAASDIVDVIGAMLPLKRAGANFQALCPFHKEKTPSFNVSPNRQTFYCFGCHKGGDVFTFVMEYEGVDFPEALKRLADRAKIPLERVAGDCDQPSRHVKDTLLEIHENITQRWQNALANDAAGQIARDYLAKRGVSEEAIKLFRLGYAPDLWDDTVNWAKSKSYDHELVEKAGLIIRKEGNANFYDRFRGRLMFPICDEQGRVVGFSGRVLSGDEKTAKYVNSPETPIFTKSKVFYGLDKSKRALLDLEYAIVCEGQLDLIACFMAGVQNVVAPQGTAFTADHARIIKRFVEEVVLCFDSDSAGQNAAVRSLDHLLASGLAIRVATVPSPHDPDSFIKASGADAFKAVIEKAEGFFDYYLNRLCATNDVATDKGRLMVLRSMAEAIHKTGNVVLIDKYAQKTALRLGVSPDAVRIEFKKLSKLRPVSTQATESAESTPIAPPPKPPGEEALLLRLLLSHDELVPWAAINLQPNWITHPSVKAVFEHRLKKQREEAWHGVAEFLGRTDSAETKALVAQLTMEARPIPNPAQQLADVTQLLRNQFIDRQVTALMRHLSQPEITEEQRVGMLQQQQQLRELKRQKVAAPA